MIFPGLIDVSSDVDEPVVFVVKLYNLSKEKANENYVVPAHTPLCQITEFRSLRGNLKPKTNRFHDVGVLGEGIRVITAMIYGIK